MKYFNLLLVFLIISCCSSQSVFTTPGLIDENDFGVSHLVQFEGLKLHIRTYDNPNITGDGYTMLFDSGLPYFSSSWGSVLLHLIPRMTELNIKTAIFFDRYGYGYSDLSPFGIDSFDFARRLKASLNLIDYQPPYILAGWSWGGINIQSYYVSYPKDVLGLYSAEGTDKEFYYDAWWNAEMSATVETYKEFIKRNAEDHDQFIKDCLAGECGVNYGFYVDSIKLPKIALKNNQNIFPDPSNKYLNAATQELGIMFQSSLKLLNSIGELEKTNEYAFKNVPLVVFTSASNGQSWMDRQVGICNLSANSKHNIDQVSSHHILTDNPIGVVDGISDLISMIETSEPFNSFAIHVSSTSNFFLLLTLVLSIVIIF